MQDIKMESIKQEHWTLPQSTYDRYNTSIHSVFMLSCGMLVLSDSDEDGQLNKRTDGNGMEVWPPEEFDSRHPFSLPFGPKTATMRQQVESAVSNFVPNYFAHQ